MMYNVMGHTAKCLLFLSCVLMIDAKSLRGRLDIIEQRIGVVESRVSADNQLTKDMFVSLQQHFDELNNSMINFKDQICPLMDQQTEKLEQTDSSKSVEILKSSEVPVLLLLGLKREKQWTRDQVKNLTIQFTEHTDQLQKHFENLTYQINLQNGQLIKGYSKLNIEMIGKDERAKNWTRNQVEKIKKHMYEQNDLLNNTFLELRTEQKDGKAEMKMTLDQVKNLTIQFTEHTDQLENQFENLTYQINLQNGQLIKSYSKLKIEMKSKDKRAKNWTRNKLEKLTSLIHKQNDQLNNTFLDLRTELKDWKAEMKTNFEMINAKIVDKIQSKLSKIDEMRTQELIVAQQKEIKALKETQSKLLNALRSCPLYWRKFSSYCYWHVKEEKSFSEARAHCESLEATLSNIDVENTAENTFIRNIILNNNFKFVWVGDYDSNEEVQWIETLVDETQEGQAYEYPYLSNGVGDRYTNYEEKCVYIVGNNNNGCSVDYDVHFCDLFCLGQYPFICKKEAKIDINL
ncbi:C-type lectin domain family 4 member M-like [Ruditapes philippinarum]|uniref:C-type lectin domain family 4 member M-like n=1 Tax=Ruditapes philippinarum TaxID=129788 RepID=UPI00295B9084|nr:C-type lectin domain family 4 member M-like [Ruditapes philippinarum]